jgi:hypothetical protein
MPGVTISILLSAVLFFKALSNSGRNLRIGHLCHFPPGARKWSKIEHRMFCHMTANRRARPLLSSRQSLIFHGESPVEQGKVPGTCFELPVGFRDGVAVYDLEENPRELLP